jgi:hypothetical protein
MNMDRAKILKPLDDVIEEMERSGPVSENMISAWKHLNQMRSSVGLPPFPSLEPFADDREGSARR